MAHSVYYSRGIQYGRAEYRKAETKMQKVRVLQKLEDDAKSANPLTLFEKGILAFVSSQREINKKNAN